MILFHASCFLQTIKTTFYQSESITTWDSTMLQWGLLFTWVKVQKGCVMFLTQRLILNRIHRSEKKGGTALKKSKSRLKVNEKVVIGHLELYNELKHHYKGIHFFLRISDLEQIIYPSY